MVKLAKEPRRNQEMSLPKEGWRLLIILAGGFRSGSPFQGCVLAEPSGPLYLTFAPRRLENLTFFIEIIYWAPWISQVQSTE